MRPANQLRVTMRKLTAFVLGALGLFTVTPGFSADFSDNSCSDGCRIFLSGPIVAGDHGRFRKRLVSLLVDQEFGKIPKSSSIVLDLDSPGGDVTEAIKIAKSLADESVVTTVDQGKNCVSACVIVLAGGIARVVTGNIGIHRPYLSRTSSPELAKASFDKLKLEVRALFESSGVDPSLWDAMMAISPAKVRYLSEDEIDNLGLSGRNPAKFDYIDSVRAEKLGIGKPELFRRDALARQQCKPDHTFKACYSRIMTSGRP